MKEIKKILGFPLVLYHLHIPTNEYSYRYFATQTKGETSKIYTNLIQPGRLPINGEFEVEKIGIKISPPLFDTRRERALINKLLYGYWRFSIEETKICEFTLWAVKPEEYNFFSLLPKPPIIEQEDRFEIEVSWGYLPPIIKNKFYYLGFYLFGKRIVQIPHFKEEAKDEKVA